MLLPSKMILGRNHSSRWIQILTAFSRAHARCPGMSVAHQAHLASGSQRLHTCFSLHSKSGASRIVGSTSANSLSRLLPRASLRTSTRCVQSQISGCAVQDLPCRLVHTSPPCQSRFVYSKKINVVTPVFLQAEKFLGRTAIVDQHGHFTYDDLLHYSSVLSRQLLEMTGADPKSTLDGARVSFLCQNDMSYVVAQWATWIAGGIAVPLSRSHPVSELEYFVQDSGSTLLLATEEFEEKLFPIASKFDIPLKVLKKEDYTGPYDQEENAWFESEGVVITKRVKKTRIKGRFDDLLACNKFKHEPALLIYTSGTTGRPKGVVVTFGNLHAQMTGMISAWGWSQSDVILHVLPLHHIHGVVNVLMTPLFCGATCVMLPKFDPLQVWAKFINPVTAMDVRVNLFMAVPTVYAKLIENFDQRLKRGRASRVLKEYVKSACKNRIRLMVSGSAALPQPVMERWEQITGHRLLERYGMSEIGMALSNPLHGNRIPGTVGTPFPQVEVRIVQPNVYSTSGFDVVAQGNSKRTVVSPGKSGESGDLHVRGPSVFHQYWNRPDATKESFTKDGWFKTGDTVEYENGVYKIVGRTSVDVIKSGGYKISALDVERHLLSHPDIADVAVVGLPDMTWGQRVAAVVVTSSGEELSLLDLREWAADRLPVYQIPSVLRCLAAMPRNAMGKVNKKTLTAEVFPDLLSTDMRR